MKLDRCPCAFDEDPLTTTFDICKLTHRCASCLLYQKQQEEKNVKSTKKLWIAVVYQDRGNGVIDSYKGRGDWASFLGTTKDEAIEKALAAREQWGTEYQWSVDVAPVKFEVVAL